MTKEATEVYHERMKAMGFKQVNVYVHKDEADLLQAEAAVKIARKLYDFVHSVRVTSEGIEDERFDLFLYGLDGRGVPERATVLKLVDGPKIDKDQARDAEELVRLSYEKTRLDMDTRQAEQAYEEAAAVDKWDAGIQWRLTLAKRYVTGRLLRAKCHLYRVRYRKGGDHEGD